MSDFKAVILEEETAPSHAIACQQCELSKQRHRVIWGEVIPKLRFSLLWITRVPVKTRRDKLSYAVQGKLYRWG
ncbi:hypothetical protein QFZ81_006848 [Paenibacillus sp. V4I9]|uniref:hypothetical protein n=1 Tax=Paenibacillus sp. V4I9 TaxID=3042308 RepID=UPI00278B372F|nr:hypothetical protein [Paenibacillus sp. V4I9]MDQ0891760.1 hypothetical protein [Paenibacillus sp. V4I9]